MSHWRKRAANINIIAWGKRKPNHTGKHCFTVRGSVFFSSGRALFLAKRTKQKAGDPIKPRRQNKQHNKTRERQIFPSKFKYTSPSCALHRGRPFFLGTKFETKHLQIKQKFWDERNSNARIGNLWVSWGGFFFALAYGLGLV